MPDLKLIALDAEDLTAMSAHLQDAVVRAGDMAFLKAERRFAFLANRFDWVSAAGNGAIRTWVRRPQFDRRRCGVRFERVARAEVSGHDPKAKDAVLELLAISFDATDPPAGHITLAFAGGAKVRLDVECIEVEMKDMGAAWQTALKPEHSEPSDGTPS